MKLINKKVLHTTFGIGKIVNIDRDRMDIHFMELIGQKSFVYPDAFEKYLCMSDSDAQIFVLAECTKKQEQIKVEKQRVEQLRREEEERVKASKVVGKGKATTKKRSPSSKK
ncbi:hypothetical protein [Cohnella silvisoli]|uniref:Uncharacterized protein n=1 Tax=Cohnella silvisoli TaxID=2873699 RepID=A0ABV1KZ18_9BACL|nr:hypothetical protein [Cohnella silvisoli]MCD9024681.1 hypothetical protein [Cohnella silvisoli]